MVRPRNHSRSRPPPSSRKERDRASKESTMDDKIMAGASNESTWNNEFHRNNRGSDCDDTEGGILGRVTAGATFTKAFAGEKGIEYNVNAVTAERKRKSKQKGVSQQSEKPCGNRTIPKVTRPLAHALEPEEASADHRHHHHQQQQQQSSKRRRTDQNRIDHNGPGKRQSLSGNARNKMNPTTTNLLAGLNDQKGQMNSCSLPVNGFKQSASWKKESNSKGSCTNSRFPNVEVEVTTDLTIGGDYATKPAANEGQYNLKKRKSEEKPVKFSYMGNICKNTHEKEAQQYSNGKPRSAVPLVSSQRNCSKHDDPSSAPVAIRQQSLPKELTNIFEGEGTDAKTPCYATNKNNTILNGCTKRPGVLAGTVGQSNFSVEKHGTGEGRSVAPINGKKAKRKRASTAVVPGQTFKDPPRPTQSASSSHNRENSNPHNAVSQRRSERVQVNNAMKKGSSGDVIDLMSDDSEAEKDCLISSQDSPARARTRNHKLELNLSRIAVGKKVFGAECRIVYKRGMLDVYAQNSRKKAQDTRLFQIDASKDELRVMKFYYHEEHAEDTTVGSFLTLQVHPTKHNKLTTYNTSYDIKTDDDAKQYLVFEFTSAADLRNLLTMMKEEKNWHLEQFSDGSLLKAEAAPDYSASLRHSNQKGVRRRGVSKVTDAFVKNRAEDDVLLVYPFAGDAKKIEEAAEGMPEAGDPKLRGAPGNQKVAHSSIQISAEQDDSSKSSNNNDAVRSEHRRHFLTIQVRDLERLCPGEFLNDTLIDFWIQWITRHTDPQDNQVHCFSSHFYTTLVDEGIAAVEKWTAKRGINVFKKKFIFIPINDALHWSLCVVVNPGDIHKNGDDDPMSCLLFLDSLKAHRKSKVSNQVRKWLNSEWNRVHGSDVNPDPFNSDGSFPLIAPIIPYQDNSWDCGVFVCRYAYAVYCMRDQPLLRSTEWLQRGRYSLENYQPEFRFGMPEIKKLREDIRILIQNLSELYVPWKKEDDKRLKAELRREKEQEKSRGGQRSPNAQKNANHQISTDTTASANEDPIGHDTIPGQPTPGPNLEVGFNMRVDTSDTSAKSSDKTENEVKAMNAGVSKLTIASTGSSRGNGRETNMNLQEGARDCLVPASQNATGRPPSRSGRSSRTSHKPSSIVPLPDALAASSFRHPRGRKESRGSLSKPGEISDEI